MYMYMLNSQIFNILDTRVPGIIIIDSTYVFDNDDPCILQYTDRN